MADNQIAIDPTSTPQPISIADPNEKVITLTPDANEYRTMNAAFGLSQNTGITKDEFGNAISSGNEDVVREKASGKINSDRIDLAKQRLHDSGYTLKDEDLKSLLKAQDPSSVFEEHYAKQWMSHLDRSGWKPDNPIEHLDSAAYVAQTSNPDFYDWVKNSGSTFVAKQNYILANVQNAKQETTWKDRVSTVVPDVFTAGLYGEYQMRQGAAGTGFFEGGGLGSNLQAQSEALWSMDNFDEWRKEFDRIYNTLPRGYREQWASDMLYKGNGSTFVDNSVTGLNAAIGGKLLSNLGRNLASPVLRTAAADAAFSNTRRVSTVIQVQDSFNRLIRAVEDMTVPRPEGVSPSVAATATAGNIPESAVNIVAIDGINDLNPHNNPLIEFVNRLAALYDTDGTAAASAPGRLAREAANRLKDMLDSHKQDFIDTVFNSLLQRVDRTPTAELKEQLHMIQRGLAELYRGPDNQVLNVSRGIWLPGLNNRMFNLAVGTQDAELFKTIQEAQAVARRNGWAVKGDYAVGQGERVSIVRKENQIINLRKQADLLDKRAANPDDVLLKLWTKHEFDPVAGAARARASADKLQAELDKIPRHQTGVTIESQRLPGVPEATATKTKVMAESTGLRSSKVSSDLSFDDQLKNLEDSSLVRGHPDFVEPNVYRPGRKPPPEGMEGDETPAQFRNRTAAQRAYESEKITQTPKTRAQQLAEQGPVEPIIKQQGNGYYILHTVFLPENANFVRDGLLTSKLGQLEKEEFRRKLATAEVSTGIPNDWAHGWINALTNKLWISAPSEVMSIAENINRNIATHGPSVLLGLLKRGLKPVQEMPKEYWNDFNRLIRYTQNAWNAETKTPGIWFNTISDVDDWYQRNLGRMITEPEVRAYFSFKQAMLDDLNFRNMSVMSRKLAMGAKQHAISFTDQYGQKVSTPYFEGVRLDTIPQNGRVLYVRDDGVRYGQVSKVLDNHEGLEQDIKEGRAQMIHLMDPASKPLSHIDPRRPDYVISYKTEEKPLGFNHVNRLGGGHLVPKWDFFIKQADVDIDGSSRVYNGDKTMLSFQSRAQAQEAIGLLEPIRDLLSRFMKSPGASLPNDIARWENEGGFIGRDLLEEAADLAPRTGIPFAKLMDMWTGPNAAFNVHEPMVVVPKGAKIIGLGEEGTALKNRHRVTTDGRTTELIDGTKYNSLLSQTMTEFTQERDAEGLFTLRKIDTESAPHFAYEHAELLDPITSLERGYGHIVESMYLHDMKQFSMEHWLEQARPYLDATVDEIRLNPLKYFYNAKNYYQDFIPGVVYQQLEGNRLTALDFVKLQSKYDTGLKQIGQAFFDVRYGQGKYELHSMSDLPSLKKIGEWLKSTAFYMAMAAPSTYFTQAATMSYIYTIAGAKNAGKATAAMTMYGLWKMHSGAPEILEGLDREMSKFFFWEPGRFTEAVQMLEGTGLAHVGSEHAFRQGETSLGLQSIKGQIGPFGLAVKTAQRGGQAVLDLAATPFELGAATTRTSGFFTSYLEHLEKAPGGILDRQMQASMLSRAILLDANMTKAHNTRLQNALSIPLQFRSYEIRIAQMMWGKNLTVEEKQSLFAFSSMLYGLRGGGAALLGLPVADWTMEKLQEQGYTPGKWGHLSDMMVNGFPSWFFAMLSNFDDPKKRTWIDLSNWGNKGVDTVENFFDNNETIAKVLAGVAGNVWENTYKNTYGIRKAIWDMGTKDGYRLTSEDIWQAFNSIKLAGDVRTGWLALQYGEWFSRNESYLTDISKMQALLKFATGVHPTTSSDIFARQKAIQAADEDIRAMQGHYTMEITRAARAHKDNNPSLEERHLRNAAAILVGIPQHKWGETKQSGFRASQVTLDERTSKKLLMELQDKADVYVANRKLRNNK